MIEQCGTLARGERSETAFTHAALAGAVYRIRTGQSRLQFRVQGEEIIVERVGHSKGFYDD